MSNEDEKTPVAPQNEPEKTPDPETSEGGRRRKPWMAHVKATMKSHKGMKLKRVLKLAKKTYKKSRRARRGGGLSPADYAGAQDGGAVTLTPATVGAGRGRRSRSRKH